MHPSREDWGSGPNIPNRHLSIYTDGSKLDLRVGCGIYSKDLNLSISYRLPDQCSVFQAEVKAIHCTAKWLLDHEIFGENIYIFSDSQAAIKSLAGVSSTSILVNECRKSLDEIASHSNLKLYWVPGHCDITGNCEADELARSGTRLPTVTFPLIGTPLATIKLQVKEWYTAQANAIWRAESTCSTTRQTWPSLTRRRTIDLLSLNRRSIQLTTSVLTGHCALGKHAERLGLPFNDYCRSCGSEEEEETVLHLMCQCPALARKRLTTLGAAFFPSLTSLSSLDIKDIARFLIKSNWFQPT